MTLNVTSHIIPVAQNTFANVELFAADCSWFVTDSNTVLYDAKDISVYSSLWDITIAPPW